MSILAQPVLEAEPPAIALAGVHLPADGPAVRLLPLFGAFLVAYDVDTFDAKGAAEVARLALDVDRVEVAGAMEVAR